MEVKPETDMVTITDAARDQVNAVLEQQEDKDLFLRIYVQGGQGGINYGMAIDSRMQQGDSEFKVAGLDVVVDRISLPYVEGATVDYNKEGKAGFRITNPNAEELMKSFGSCGGGSCGCGSGGGGCGSGGGGCC